MKPLRLLLATALAAGTVILPATAASAATPAPGPAFGAHVSECAQTKGFSGTHNPAMMRQDMSGMDMSGMDMSGMDKSGMDKSGMDKSGMDMALTTSTVT